MCVAQIFWSGIDVECEASRDRRDEHGPDGRMRESSPEYSQTRGENISKAGLQLSVIGWGVVINDYLIPVVFAVPK